MRIIAIGNDFSRVKPFKESEKVTQPKEPAKQENKAVKTEKVLPLASAALAAISLGVAIYATRGRKNTPTTKDIKQTAEEAIEKAKDEIKNASEKAVKDLKDKVETVEQKVNANEAKIKDNQKWNDGFLDDMATKVRNVESRPTEIKSGLVMDRNWAWSHDGMRLRQNTDNEGNRIALSKTVVEKLRNNASKFITGKDSIGNTVPIAALGAGAAVWLPSAETKPEKEGGLGEVPVQMATNFVKEYGITESYIPRPLIEIPGKSYIKELDGKWQYWYDGLKNEKGEDIVMDVDKVAEYETVAYHNGQSSRETIEVFYGIDPIGGYKRLMFRNPNYFAADGLYASTETAEEPERYTFFTRALYDFIKLVKDPKSITHAKLAHPTLFKSIKAPDTIALNDWHVAPLAALMRTLAPVEASHKKLSAKAAENFENLNIMYIVHNADYQGQNYPHRDDLLNTLFGQYAVDIVENAKTGYYEEYYDEYGNKQQRPIQDLRSPFLIGNSVNMANMAMSYANIVKPVSVTYAKEMAEQVARSGGLQHASVVRKAAGTMIGQSNGWDRSVNEVSQASLPGFNNNLNKDIFTIFKHTIDNLEWINTSERNAINAVFAEHKNKLNVNNFEIILARLDRLNIPTLDKALKELKDAGLTELRSFHRATVDMPKEELMAARKHNKLMLFKHIKTMIEYDKKYPAQKLFNIEELGNTDLSSIDPDKLDEIPFFNMGVRFVGQKGVDIVSRAWIDILSSWDELFPEKPKPFINIGGKDPSANGVYKNMIKGAKDSLGDKGNTLVQWDGFVPNNILMAGSDWTMRPSHFEPDGDKWESLYKGTPMVMTRVGGHIDSIKDEFNGFLTERTIPEIKDFVDKNRDPNKSREEQILDEKVKDYSAALIKALKYYYYNRSAYEDMVMNAINGNQSWVIKDKDGKIQNCSSLAHLKDLGFDLSQFPQVAENTYKS